MIYYNDVLVSWNKKNPNECNEIEKQVRDQILGNGGIKEKYFGEGTERKVRVLYPKGVPEDADAMGLLRPKLFPLQLFSADNQWRFSRTKRVQPTKVNPTGFREHHEYITHKDIYKEKDIEFVWYLVHHAPALGKKIFIEDLEADAKYEIEDMGADAAIRFMLTSPLSPVAKDEETIRKVAEIFNIPELDKKKFNQIKLALYDAIQKGEEDGDSFCNYTKFDELINGATKRETAFLARRAMTDKVVAYKAADRGWYLMAGKDYDQLLLTLKSSDVTRREEVFIEEVINNINVRDRVFGAMGVDVEMTADKLRELDHKTLKAKYRDVTGEYKNLNKEDLIKGICDELKIEYSPVE